VPVLTSVPFAPNVLLPRVYTIPLQMRTPSVMFPVNVLFEMRAVPPVHPVRRPSLEFDAMLRSIVKSPVP